MNHRPSHWIAADGFRLLRCEDEHAVLLADGAALVLHEGLKVRDLQWVLHFIEEVGKSPSVEHLFSSIEQVRDRGITYFTLVEKLRQIESEEIGFRQIEFVGLVVEHPAILMTRAPALEPVAQAKRHAL